MAVPKSKRKTSPLEAEVTLQQIYRAIDKLSNLRWGFDEKAFQAYWNNEFAGANYASPKVDSKRRWRINRAFHQDAAFRDKTATLIVDTFTELQKSFFRANAIIITKDTVFLDDVIRRHNYLTDAIGAVRALRSHLLAMSYAPFTNVGPYKELVYYVEKEDRCLRGLRDSDTKKAKELLSLHGIKLFSVYSNTEPCNIPKENEEMKDAVNPDMN